jgi:hypothetical protein
MTGSLWLLATVIGVAILGLALAYGIRQTNLFRRNPRNVERADEATKRQYEDGGNSGRTG